MASSSRATFPSPTASVWISVCFCISQMPTSGGPAFPTRWKCSKSGKHPARRRRALSWRSPRYGDVPPIQGRHGIPCAHLYRSRRTGCFHLSRGRIPLFCLAHPCAANRLSCCTSAGRHAASVQRCNATNKGPSARSGGRAFFLFRDTRILIFLPGSR